MGETRARAEMNEAWFKYSEICCLCFAARFGFEMCGGNCCKYNHVARGRAEEVGWHGEGRNHLIYNDIKQKQVEAIACVTFGAWP